jgi:exonuclease III
MPDQLHSSPLRVGTLNVGLGFVRKLPALLARCAALALDAVAVQEIGDPALHSSRLPPYHLVYAAGSSHHQGGVGLLLSTALLPRVRSYRRSSSGRLLGAVLELSAGHQLLLVSAYMPTGLDHSSPASEPHALALQLYAELLQWSVGMQQVLLLGDLNQTCAPWDRQPAPAAPARGPHATPAPINTLEHEGFVDAFRALYPDGARTPGYTHVLEGARKQSRLDYIWCKGLAPDDMQRVRVDTRLHALSHHRLLWAQLRLPQWAAGPAEELAPPLQLPNLRAATAKQLQSFGAQLEQQLLRHERQLQQLAAGATADDPAALNDLASSLTALTHCAASDTLPHTGAAAYRCRNVLQLQRTRQLLSQLLSTARSVLQRQHPHRLPSAMLLTRCPRWLQLHRRCQQHGIAWRQDAWSCGDAAAWLAETEQLLRDARRAIRQKQLRMSREQRAQYDANPAAAVHRMLRSDALPAQLHSVLNADGALTSSGAELRRVMAEHFRAVFAVPPAPAHPLPHDPPAMLFEKDGVDASWYDGLLAEVGQEELLAVANVAPLVSAPGEDEVSSGLWKLALQGSEQLRQLVSRLFSGCLRTGTFPSCWKSSVIVPLLKDAQKERSMSNVRPISLQSCLGKLLNRLLAQRLGAIFARHPILNPAQRGFVLGGCINKCIDELLDAWSVSRAPRQRELYTLFYDIRQAYDSVQVDVLERALRRLRMPELFVRLVVDSLTGLTSRVRTAYGLSEAFAVLRSVRQGDPLAPLLFVCLLDALHDGLLRNPFTNEQHGLRLRISDGDVLSLPSLGYADDTTVLTSTLDDLRVQNDWVHYFLAFNRMRLNHTKCELVGRTAAGQPVTAAALAAHGIAIEGHSIEPLAHSQPLRYLGLHVRFDGSWQTQQQKSLAKIGVFTRAITKFRVSLSMAAYMFNVFLLPGLELSLHYVHGVGTSAWIKQCDRLLIGCIKHAAGSLLRLSHSAVALLLRFSLPSWLEASIKVSELFLRLNSSDGRWGALGRALARAALPAVVDASTALPRADTGRDRLGRAARITVTKLGWSLHRHEERAAGARGASLLNSEPVGTQLNSELCSSSPSLQLAAGRSQVAHDLWRSWGAALPAHTVHVYTDGSHDAHAQPTPTSSWAVTIGDQWLTDNYGGVPADEQLLQPHHVAGATLYGASILCTRGVYPAELQAIARVLAMFPASHTLHVHTDSRASIAAVGAHQRQPNERKRMRMAARPLLRLISHLLRVREAAQAGTLLVHVRAHTTDTDLHSVGNRLTDYQANLARARPDRPRPIGLLELPLSDCEPHLHIVDCAGSGLQVIDDIRRSALAQCRRAAMLKRQADPERGYFPSASCVDASRDVLRHGSPAQQITFLHVATNSVHYHLVAAAGADGSHLQQLSCEDCAMPLTLEHLSECMSEVCATFRRQLATNLHAMLARHAPAAACCLRMRGAALPQLIGDLFPPAIGASDDERRRTLCTAMCGLFSSAQVKSAARTLGFTSAGDLPAGRKALVDFRLLCLSALDDLYATRKAIG